MKTIHFSDGTTMPFEQFRAMCLNDAKTIADHGQWQFRGILRCAFGFLGMWLVCVVFALVEFRSGFIVIGTLYLLSAGVFALLFLWGYVVALDCRQRCLQRRQNIMDSLDRITKAFEDK